MSPMAQSRSPARIRSSVSTAWASGSRPTVSRPMSGQVGPAPGGHQQLLGLDRRGSPASSVNVPSCVDPVDLDAGAHLDALAPRRRRATSRADSGSSRPSSRSAASTHGDPHAEAGERLGELGSRSRPPPITTRLPGSSVSLHRRRGWSSTACPPGRRSAGAAGSVPVLSTTPRAATYVRRRRPRPRPAPTRRPRPRTSRTPASSSASAWASSFQSSVASLADPAATGAPVGRHVDRAGEVGRPGGPRRAWSAARIIILEGMQP